MTSDRRFTVFAAVLALVALSLFVLGSLYAFRESQREETWHERAVANAGTVNHVEWLAVRSGRPMMEWRFKTASRPTYLVQLLDDRRFVSAVFAPGASKTPHQYTSGRVGQAEWDALKEALERLFAEPLDRTRSANKATYNVTIRYSRGNAAAVTRRYSTTNFAAEPELYREFDEHLFAALADAAVKPSRGHARTQPTISYSAAELPDLMRGLLSDREAAYPSIVRRMVSIGKPALPLLIQTLRDGAKTRYLPISRYVSVIDALAELDGPGGQSAALIKAIADESVTLAGRKKLKEHAQAIVARDDIAAYLREHWRVAPKTEQLFRDQELPADVQESLQTHLARSKRRQRTTREAAVAALVEMGPVVLPRVLRQLKDEGSSRRSINNPLLDVLAKVGGSDAVIYVIRDHNIDPAIAAISLGKTGERGLPGLLLLLEHPDAEARSLARKALKDDSDFAAQTAYFTRQIERNLDIVHDTESIAVRDLQQDAITSLVGVLRKHKAFDPGAVAAFVQVATDAQLPDRPRIGALDALRDLGPTAATSIDPLQDLAGYESGQVLRALTATLTAIKPNDTP